MVMARAKRTFDHDFQEGAIRIVKQSGRPVAQIARELGINEGTLGNWMAADRSARGAC
jgi:transposase